MNKTGTARQALGVLGADAPTADVINYCEDILKVTLSADTVRAARKAVAEAVRAANPELDEDPEPEPTPEPTETPATRQRNTSGFVFEEKDGESKDERRKRYAREYCKFRYDSDPAYAAKRKAQSGISHKAAREAKKAAASAE